MLASANKEEELIPWASIIVKDAFHPHVELDIRPATNRLMCPTEE